MSNGHILRDLIYYAENENLPAALLSLDQMKAFDRVNWNFLFKTLESFGFGPQFISYIKTLYSNISSRVKVNGYISAPFTLGRGVRQGCPLSRLLYVLVSEIFAISIRKNQDITGITIKNVEFKITQYADDTTIILQGEHSIKSPFDCVQDFEMASGAKINKGKSNGIWLGRYKNRSDNPYNLKWGREALKILGVFHGPILKEKETWDPRVNKFIKTLDLWTSRDLSLRGRAVVANQLASSVFWYTAAIYPLPQWALKKINDKLWKFIYQNKKDPIKRTQARLPYELGGLNIIDIEKKADAIKLSWISKYLQNDNQSKWKALFALNFDKYKNFNIGAKIFKCYLRPIEMKHVPQFYRDVIKCFATNFSDLRLKPTDIEGIYNEPLFDNYFTHVDTSNAWIQANITTIRDISYEFTTGFLPSNALHELIPSGFSDSFYSKLKSRLPPEWKEKITTECSNERSLSDDFYIKNTKDEYVLFSSLNCKAIYNMLILKDQNVVLQKFRVFWEQKIGFINWPRLFKTLFKRNHDRKSANIQWKFLQLCLPTYERLYRHRIVQTPTCQRCNSHVETSLHTFFNCTPVSKLWKFVFKLVKKINPTLNLNNICKFVILGFYEYKPDLPVENFLRDAAFSVIWKTRNEIIFDNKRDDLKNRFIFKVISKLKEEHFIASQDVETLNLFEQKWCQNGVLASLENRKLKINIP